MTGIKTLINFELFMLRSKANQTDNRSCCDACDLSDICGMQ